VTGSDSDAFQRRLGERLRRVREEQRLTLRAVEVLSHGRFNPITLAAYERGDRALKVQTAAELAWALRPSA
jgi:transcriptional regulator with XRE-family HTH domain